MSLPEQNRVENFSLRIYQLRLKLDISTHSQASEEELDGSQPCLNFAGDHYLDEEGHGLRETLDECYQLLVSLDCFSSLLKVSLLGERVKQLQLGGVDDGRGGLEELLRGQVFLLRLFFRGLWFFEDLIARQDFVEVRGGTYLVCMLN